MRPDTMCSQKVPLALVIALFAACRLDTDPAGPQGRLAVAANTVGADAEDERPQYGPWGAPVNLGAVVNSKSNEQHPAISPDGRSLYISSDRPGTLGMLDIWVSHRDRMGAPWGAPQHLGPNINSPGNDLAPAFSPDGHHMYFHSTGRGGCGLADLFVARRSDKHDDVNWEPAENLGCVINSPYSDAGPTYFEDEATGITTLYFTRLNNPPGSDKGWDVYASTRLGDDAAWGPGVLVPELSSPYRDTRTAIRRDGLELFLSSGRPGDAVVGRSAGSEDLWVSTRATTIDPWSPPLNLNLVNARLGGPPINSAAFDGAPALSFDGTELYFFSARPGGFGGNDLYVTTRARLHARSVEPPAAPLVRHLVAPHATDAAIDQFLDDHYVWLDTTAHSNHELLVFMPGHGQRPVLFQLVQREAARLGYHVIGLTYPDGVSLGQVCRAASDPASCYERTHLEILDGVDRSPFVNVSPANSIDNRLTKLLQYLAAQYPSEGWSRFLDDDGGPAWPRIAVAGHSQGGGQAAVIGKIRSVARVVLFSAVTDGLPGGGAAPWVAGHLTPVTRYYGIDNDRDGNYATIRNSWTSMGLDVFGPPAAPETGTPPYGGTHVLVTDVTPVGGFVGTNAHGSPSNDLNTPLRPDGTPVLRDAWRYLLTAREHDEGERHHPQRARDER